MQSEILEGFRLSPQQKRLWSLQHDGYSSSGMDAAIAYRAQCSISLEGSLDAEVLKNALHKVVERHEILRTTFHRRPGIRFPIQVIADCPSLSWHSINLSNLEPQEQAVRIEQAFQQERQWVFDFEGGSLFRVCLLTLSCDRHILLVNLPSLYADSWTLKNLVQEISQAYALCLNGEEFSDEPIQYIQFSEWQNELLEGEDVETGRNYWQQQNLASIPVPVLPFEGKPNRQTKFVPEIQFLKICPDIVTKIEKNCTLHNTTIADFLIACWQTLFWRLTKQSNLVINTVFTGRNYEELENSLGLLAKSIPVCCPFQDNLKFHEVLSQIGRALRNTQKWQEYFVWEENQKSTGETVDFPISFEFEEWLDKYCAGGVSFSLEKHYVCFDRFKVKLSCVRKGNSLATEFHYDPELIDKESIECIAEQFHTLVESAANNPEATVSELEILSDRTRHQLLVEFNNTQTNYPQNQCIHHRFEQQVEQTPNNIAVVFEDQQLTYAELNARANKLAHYLQKLGVKPDVLVGICLERSLEIVIAILGILKAGGGYLPLDPALPTEGLAFRLQDAKAPILLTQQVLVEKLPKNAAQVVCLDADWEVIDREDRENLHSEVKPEHLVYALFTSGSTGKPKGVAVEHRQLFNYLQGILDKLNLPVGASFATVSTFAADLGNTVIFPALCTGGCLHVISQDRASDPEALADYFQHHPIDCLKIVPSHLAALLASSSPQSVLPRQYLVLGGEAVSWNLIEKLQKQSPTCQILNHYGPTETTVGVLTYPVKNRQASHNSETVPLGRPLANTQVYILDEQLQPVPIGVPGELYIGGAGLARGYLNRPELTAERFVKNPFGELQAHGSESGARLYKTGDLARYLPDTTVEFLGRVDHQVKVRGFRIELGEIEAVLRQHQAVQEVVVVAREEVLGDKRLVAYIVGDRKFRTLNSALISDLRSFCLGKLPEYMVPSAFVMLKALPLTPNGKVDRQSLPAPDRTRSGVEDLYVAPRTPVEEQLTQIWAQVLGLERVGVRDNFFELGGHSLLLTQLLVRVRDAFQVNLSLGNLFESPTVEDLAKRIQAVQQTESSTQVEQQTLAALSAEAVLDPTIRPDLTSNPPVSENAIFLTGATGFLGAFLLYELLQQSTADIYCLVRSFDSESGKKKIQASLESYLLWHESLSSRIIPIVGDLSEPLLGLGEEPFRRLASKVDAIYHNGAWVHHTSPYSTLKAANVLGTQEILRLASQVKLKPVHFISTISVFSSASHSGVEVVREQDSLDDREIPSDGYAQSKWVAEKLVTIARDRGIPTCIYRPGRISGHSQTGVFNTNDFLYRLIMGCIQLGSTPAGNKLYDIAPVDYVSRAIIYLSKQKESLGKAFHVINPRPLHSSLLINSIRSLGYPLQQISYDQWQTQLLNIARNFPEHALYPLVPFFLEGESHEELSYSGVLEFDCRNTLDGLAGTSIICPPIDEKLLHTYFSYLMHNGFLSPPQSFQKSKVKS